MRKKQEKAKPPGRKLEPRKAHASPGGSFNKAERRVREAHV